MTRALGTRLVLVVSAIATAFGACTVQQTAIPPLTGPSEFGLSVRVSATPDTVSRDGVSQSAVVLTTRGSDGAPLGNVPLRLDMAVGEAIQDFGTLSAKNVVTGQDGRVTVTYTAPPAPPPGVPSSAATLRILATTVGTNAQASATHSAEIRIVPVGVILPPLQSAGPRFAFSPSAPDAHTPVTFDASASCAGPVDPTSDDACPSGHGVIVSYQWNFGDGTTAQGRVVSHTFTNPRSYGVTLTVTNDRGGSGSTTQVVGVNPGQGPTADFVFSPAAPLVGQLVQFNASTSTAAPGRHIVRYTWNWGDDSSTVSSSRPFQDHDYFEAGTYNVTLTVRDNVGLETTVVKQVAVGAGNPTASFVVSPQPPVGTGVSLTLDASASLAAPGATIASYTWSFGDGTGSGPNPSPTVNTSYGAAGTFTVTLTVTDNLGRTGTASQAVRIE